jgi:hypothetical protein
MSSLQKERILDISSDVYIKPIEIPEEVHIFKSSRWPETHIISDSMVTVLKEAKITGYIIEETICI